ncbi:MAG: non-ribosomal peptide synthetase, partial [bacterium]|nr:non-ribosomal peptide synthetase [bacterium]
FSQWQNSPSQKKSIKTQENYWLEQFRGENPVLRLPVDYPRPSIQSFDGALYTFEISREQTGALMQIATGEGGTLYMVLISLFSILLSKLSGQEEIVIGTPVAGRPHADLQTIIGMFVNTLALKHNTGGNKSFKEYFRAVKENTLRAFENQEYQFEDLVEKVMGKRDVGRNPLFDVMFSFEYGRAVETENNTQSPDTIKLAEKKAKFDLTLTVLDTPNTLHFNFGYSTKLFKEETIKRFATYFKSILQTVPQHPHQKISDIEIITEEERNRILYEFN